MTKTQYPVCDTDSVYARPGRITIEDSFGNELLIELEDTVEHELALKLCHALLDCLANVPTNDHPPALAADVASAKALIVKLAKLHMDLERAKACTCTIEVDSTESCPIHSAAARRMADDKVKELAASRINDQYGDRSPEDTLGHRDDGTVS